MTTPTQRQRELADRILRMLSARFPILEHSQYEDAVAQLLADAQANDMEKLRKKVKQAKKRAQEWQAYLDELDGVE